MRPESDSDEPRATARTALIARMKVFRERDLNGIPISSGTLYSLPQPGCHACLNPGTGEVENLDVLFFSTRLLRKEMFQLPISADLRLAKNDGT